jgi:hypothetical protein
VLGSEPSKATKKTNGRPALASAKTKRGRGRPSKAQLKADQELQAKAKDTTEGTKPTTKTEQE